MTKMWSPSLNDLTTQVERNMHKDRQLFGDPYQSITMEVATELAARSSSCQGQPPQCQYLCRRRQQAPSRKNTPKYGKGKSYPAPLGAQYSPVLPISKPSIHSTNDPALTSGVTAPPASQNLSKPTPFVCSSRKVSSTPSSS